MIYAISISLFVILLISYKIFKGNITRPSVIFTSGLFLASLVACSFAKQWDLITMDKKTIFMIIGGSLLAFVTDLLTCRVNNTKKEGLPNEISFIVIRDSRLIVFAILQAFFYFLYLRAKIANVGAVYAVAEAIGEINEMTKFDDTFTLYIPWYINVPYAFFQAFGFIWAVLLPIYLCSKKTTHKTKILVFINYFLVILGCMIQGGRMPILNYIIPCFMFYILISAYLNKGKVQIKKYLLIILGALAFIFLFQQIGIWIGRSELDHSGIEIFAEYCGAQIKNLDTVISLPPRVNDDSFAPMTFMKIYNSIAPILGTSASSIDYNTVYTFQSIHGYHLGNVYTCYANYYLDLGLFGLIFVVVAIWLTCKFYSKIHSQKLFGIGIPNIWCYLYAKFIGLLFLAFFHEQFYAINPISLLRGTIYIYIGYLFLFPRNTKFNYLK